MHLYTPPSSKAGLNGKEANFETYETTRPESLATVRGKGQAKMWQCSKALSKPTTTPISGTNKSHGNVENVILRSFQTQYSSEKATRPKVDTHLMHRQTTDPGV